MAVRRTSTSSSYFLISIVILTLLISLKPNNGFQNAHFLKVSSGSDVKVYPGRNSPGWRRTCSAIVSLSPFSKASLGLKLVNITLVASLLLLAGDVSSNPGPVTDPCGLCSKGCRKNQRAVQCDDCDTWYHAKCIHMGMDEYINLC